MGVAWIRRVILVSLERREASLPAGERPVHGHRPRSRPAPNFSDYAWRRTEVRNFRAAGSVLPMINKFAILKKRGLWGTYRMPCVMKLPHQVVAYLPRVTGSRRTAAELLLVPLLTLTAYAQPVANAGPKGTVETWASGLDKDGHVPYHPQVTAYFCGAAAMVR